MSNSTNDKSKHPGYTEDSRLNSSDDNLEGRWSNIQVDYRKTRKPLSLAHSIG